MSDAAPPALDHEAPALKMSVITPRDLLSEFVGSPQNFIDNHYNFKKELAIDFTSNGKYSLSYDLESGYARFKDEGHLNVRVGDFTSEIKKAVSEGQRFDIIFALEVSWVLNRIDLLFAIQNSLKEGGKAFVPLNWWAPNSFDTKDGINESVIFNDLVQTSDGNTVSLADYLVDQYPGSFAIAHYPGAKTLIIKGTEKPVLPPNMVILNKTGEKVRMGFPQLVWGIR